MDKNYWKGQFREMSNWRECNLPHIRQMAEDAAKFDKVLAAKLTVWGDAIDDLSAYAKSRLEK